MSETRFLGPENIYIYIYVSLVGEDLEPNNSWSVLCILWMNLYMGIEFGMKQPLGSIWRKSMQSQESGMESGSDQLCKVWFLLVLGPRYVRSTVLEREI